MFHDIEQNNDIWLGMRSGKLTGSNIAKVMANNGKSFGEPAKKLAVNIAIEQITGQPIANGFSNDHMQRGHDQEPIARQLYEQDYFCTVDNGGFYDNGFTGCSPDGLVGDDGVIEIKSVIPSVHFQRFKNNAFDSTYKWQLYFNLIESGRKWIDFVSFCADFPEEKRLFVQRIDRAECLPMTKRISDFKQLVKDSAEIIGCHIESNTTMAIF